MALGSPVIISTKLLFETSSSYKLIKWLNVFLSIEFNSFDEMLTVSSIGVLPNTFMLIEDKAFSLISNRRIDGKPVKKTGSKRRNLLYEMSKPTYMRERDK